MATPSRCRLAALALSVSVFFLLGLGLAPAQALAEGTAGRGGGEQEVDLLEIPDMGGPGGSPLLSELAQKTRITAFFVGSAAYNSGVFMIPEFAGEAPAKTLEPGTTNARYDKFGLGISTTFAPWLRAFAAVEFENHIGGHSHCHNRSFSECVLDPENGSEGVSFALHGHGEAALDRFSLTLQPPGSNFSVSLGRFDVPFGFERHDETSLLTASHSLITRYARPNLMTGVMASYTFSPQFDATAWVVNRWENEFTGEDEFDDNNAAKSLGGRIGFYPLRDGSLNIGVGGWWGPEPSRGPAAGDNDRRLVDVDFTYSPSERFLLRGEGVWGAEDNVYFPWQLQPPNGVGGPITKDVTWKGFALLAHYEVSDWVGLTGRWDWLDDTDGGRTGVPQTLQSVSIAPVLHLSRLIPGLRPTGAAFERTRHPVDWVDLKFEYRYNWSSEEVFAKELGAGPEVSDSSHEFEIQVVVNFANFL